MHDGVAALAKLASGSYDLVFSDLRMPELDGAGLFQELERRKYPRLSRFVFVTGDVRGGDVREFLERTGALCLSKPFSLDEVRRIVVVALNR